MPSQLTLKDAAPQYLEHLQAAGKNEHTVRTYGKALEVIAGFFGEAKALRALRPADVGRFLKSNALLKKPNGKERAKPTTDQITRVLRMLLEWAQANGHVASAAFPPGRHAQAPSEAAHHPGAGGSVRSTPGRRLTLTADRPLLPRRPRLPSPGRCLFAQHCAPSPQPLPHSIFPPLERPDAQRALSRRS